MKPTVSQRAFWSALAAAAAPYALYLLFSRRLQPTHLHISLSAADLYDDLFDGEVAAAG